MTREELSLNDTFRVVMAILASTGAVFGLVFIAYICTWCFHKKRSDEEQMLKGAVLSSAASQGGGKKGGSQYDHDNVIGIDYQLGKLQFGVSYNERHQELSLKIFRAQGLPETDMSGGCDPYVRISILPDEKKEFKTQVRKNKLNPVWNESFLFQGWNKKKLNEKTLYLLILDFDRMKQDDQVGEIFIPLSTMDLNANVSTWHYLQPCKNDKENRLGEIYVSIMYDPEESNLTVGVIKAKDLLMLDITGASDPFIKICVIIHGKRVEKRKTQVKHNSTNPVFNEVFTFNVESDKINHSCVEFVVLDYDQFDNNDRIGKVLLGSHSSPPEARQWNDMMFHPRQQIDSWQVLRE